MEKINLSVLILTYNEEVNLENALKNAMSFSDDVYVLDSYSNDKTVDIAKRYLGEERIYFRKFDTFSSQRNWALENIPFKHEWLLMLDADEIVPKKGIEEIYRIIQKCPTKIVGFYAKFEFYFLGRKIPYITWPFQKRVLFKWKEVRYSPIITDLPEAINNELKWGKLKQKWMHIDNKTFHWFNAKHNDYSTVEAFNVIKNLPRFSLIRFFEKDVASWRANIKALFYKIPFHSFLYFLYLYIFRIGFIAGKAGLDFCVYRSFFQYLITVKIQDIKQRGVTKLEDYKNSVDCVLPVIKNWRQDYEKNTN